MERNTKWYVMRVTYGRELKLKEYLDSISVSSYIPMHYVNDPKDQDKKKSVPIIRNLIFILSSRIRLDEIKSREDIPPTRYIIDKSTNKPMIVDNRAMDDFIKVSSSSEKGIMYLSEIERLLGRGDRVRITSGIFEGIEGEIVRIKRDRRVVVSIKGLIAVATTFIHPSQLQKI
ncbi:MAG: UpxY family transcription antiterminator [Bacteroidales bacterium]